MALNLSGKKAIVQAVSEVAQSSAACVVAEYRGLTSENMTLFRKKAREHAVHVQVVRNKLAQRALIKTDFACLESVLIGPVLLAFSKADPGSAARLIRDFSKEYELMTVKALALGGKMLDRSQLEAVANLPTKEQALSRLLAVMQAPIVKLARTFQAVPLKLTRTLVAVKEQKAEQSGE
jgi:large subunit ribosomal protein L10